MNVGTGKVAVVGIGSGDREGLTGEALRVLRESEIVVGYRPYMDLIKELIPGHQRLVSGMGAETERCREAVRLAREGWKVAVVSSGDPGVYGMAGLVLEIAHQSGSGVEIEVIPGVTAANLAAAALGAPLMNDFAVISLSDLLTPWEKIQRRLELCAQADLIICLYNPKSRGRTEQIGLARDILLQHRSPATPVGIVREAGRPGQRVAITRLDALLEAEIDMSTVVIIGNEATYVSEGQLITPRGYRL